MELKKKIRKEKINLVTDTVSGLVFTFAWVVFTVGAMNKISTTEGIVMAILALSFFAVMMFLLGETNKDKSRLKQLRLKAKGICEYNEECNSYPEKCKTCANNTAEPDMYIDINSEE